MRKSWFFSSAAATGSFILAIFISSAAKAEKFVFDTKKTEVRFSYVMGFATQYGKFNKVEGTLRFDEGAPEKAQVSATVSTASLGTGEPVIDDELKQSDFFDVDANPVMTFKSRAVRPTGPNTAEMSGDITVKGITKPITLEVSLHPHKDPALKYAPESRKFVAKGRIQRSAFNMTAYQGMVGDDVEIEIDAIVRKKL